MFSAAVILLFLLAGIVGAVDAVLLPAQMWRTAGVPRALWIPLQLVLGLLGALIYVTVVRPRITGATRPTPA